MEPEIRILHLDSNHPLLMQRLSSAGFTNHENFHSSLAEIETIIDQYDGIVLRSRFRIDRELLSKATKLRFIARVGAGLENIDCEYAEQRNIFLISAPEGNRNAVGEHTLAMLLSLFNNLNTADRQVRQGEWNREKNRGHELDGKTVGIIGYGNMGKSFAKKLRGFDVEVLCHDILPNVGDQNARQVPLEVLMQNADVLSLHVPWTPLTNNMVNADFIAGFAKPFWLINTSRGKNVVTADLAAALQSGKVLGAGLDVLEYEKSSFENLFEGEIPDALKYLLASDNVLLSPHIAGWTHESNERLAGVIADKIIAHIKGANEVETKKASVTGIGGFFFKSRDSKALVQWYADNLGFKTDDYGSTFWWKDKDGNDCSTQWSPFGESTEYFLPSEKQFMQNFRVDDLESLLDQLSLRGINQVGEMQVFDYGKFAWIMDPEGNKIELWQPNDRAFL